MPKSRRDVEAALLGKGFQGESGDHRFFIYVTQDGKKTRARTKTSHSSKMREIPDNLLTQMAKQCKLTKRQFLDLVDCPLDRDEYERLLAQQGET